MKISEKQEAWHLYFSVMAGRKLFMKTSGLKSLLFTARGTENQVHYLSQFWGWSSALTGEDLIIFKEVVAACGLIFHAEKLKLKFFLNIKGVCSFN